MKKPYLSKFERQLIYCDTVTGAFIELRYRWQYVKRDIDKSMFGEFLHKAAEWLDKNLDTSKSSCFLDCVRKRKYKWVEGNNEPYFNKESDPIRDMQDCINKAKEEKH